MGQAYIVAAARTAGGRKGALQLRRRLPFSATVRDSSQRAERCSLQPRRYSLR